MRIRVRPVKPARMSVRKAKALNKEMLNMPTAPIEQLKEEAKVFEHEMLHRRMLRKQNG